MSGERVVVIGDALLDRDVEGHAARLCPDAPVPVLEETARRMRPGGAGLAAGLLAADGARVTLVTALARDPAGAELSRALLRTGVDLLDLGLDGSTPEKVRFRCGQSLLRLDRGGAPGRIEASGAGPTLRAALAGADAVLVSDYGRGLSAHPEVRAALEAAGRRPPLLWDPHPRGAPPVPGATLVTPNLSEALAFEPGSAADGGPDLPRLAGKLRARWQAAAVCVTRGEEGALLVDGEAVTRHPVTAAAGDSCGAGDRFAATAALRLAVGVEPAGAVGAAVAAAARFVASGGAATALRQAPATPERRRGRPESDAVSVPPSFARALELCERVRGEGGTVVATGGCFDLLHIGHVQGLEAAATLGDALVVLLNSDRSVRELKGSDRPLVAEEERAAMLRALACVGEVGIFDEPTPREALGLLRPDVWAKGGDYDLEQLPESEEVVAWGGRTAILPYHEGRSTSRLIEEVDARAAT